MIQNLILTLFDAVPNFYSTQYVPYPMFKKFENIITVDLNYGVAKVENSIRLYPSCCVPKMHQLYVKSVVRDFDSILIYKIL